MPQQCHGANYRLPSGKKTATVCSAFPFVSRFHDMRPASKCGARCFVGQAMILLWSVIELAHAGALHKASPASSEMTLWQIVDALPRLIPFTKDNVEKMLAVRLEETDYTGNDVFLFYRSNPIRLSDAVTVSNIDLRIRRKGGHPGFMVLSIDRVCVTLDQVRGRYADLQITETPRGSPGDQTSYSTMLQWGKLSFGFAERNPNCLASIVFNPKKSQ